MEKKINCDHSKKVLKSHSDIHKAKGFLEQRETNAEGGCCSNAG